jgi:hypothetical protein
LRAVPVDVHAAPVDDFLGAASAAGTSRPMKRMQRKGVERISQASLMTGERSFRSAPMMIPPRSEPD